MFSRSCFIEQSPVPEDLSAEVVTEGLLAYDVDVRAEGISEICIESAHLEEAVVVRCQDAEVVVAALGVVAAGPGAEEVHADHPMAGRYSSDYLTELLERVLLHLVHGYVMAFALYKQGSGPVRSPISPIFTLNNDNRPESTASDRITSEAGASAKVRSSSKLHLKQ